MSIIRFMMLSYMICNLEKIVARLLFLIVYIYVSSVFIVALHDGFVGLLKFREPLVLYVRMYSIVKWYYHNMSMLSFGMGLKMFLVLGSTFMVQYSIWNINWRMVPIMILRLLRRLISNIRSRKPSLGWGMTRINVDGFGYIRNKIVDDVDESIQDILGTVLMSRRNKTTNEDLTSLKKSLLIKIECQIDDLIRDAMKSMEKR